MPLYTELFTLIEDMHNFACYNNSGWEPLSKPGV